MSPFLGELLGTMMLVLFGDGVVANVVLSKTKGQNSGWIVITSGWAFAVVVGVFTAIAFGSPGAHLNPAVTVFFATVSGDWSNAGTLIAGQFAGAFIGAVLVYLAYLLHWKETENPALKLATFCTAPAVRSTGPNLVTEIIGTFALVVGVAAIFSKGVSPTGPVAALGPYLVGVLVWGIGLSLGGPTGYAINPARDLGPRIAHAVLPIPGKGDSDWGYSWIPVVGPIVGAVLGALLVKPLLG